MAMKWKNNSSSVIADVGGISAAASSLTVTAITGSRFPTITSPDYFMITIVDTDGNREIAKCTARSSDTLTIVRAQEGTAARAFDAGSLVELRPTAGTFDYLADKITYAASGVGNLAPTPGVTANSYKLAIFTKASGVVVATGDPITVAIPDGTGLTWRERSASYLSGLSWIFMEDGENYWSKGSADGVLKSAYLYAIWDGTGIVFALAGYAGFNTVPITTTETDDDFFLLELNSTYTRDADHYCVCIAKIKYTYYTSDSPDHTISTEGENAPKVLWSPPTDYAKMLTLTTTNTVAGDVTEYSAASVVVKQSGRYLINANATGAGSAATTVITVNIKTGSSTYGSATLRAQGVYTTAAAGYVGTASATAIIALDAGDTIHLGAAVTSGSGNRTLYGDNTATGRTALTFQRID